MSTFTRFARRGWFPFCMAQLTTAQIDAYRGPDNVNEDYPSVTKITGLSLQEAARIYWLLDTVKVTGTVAGYNPYSPGVGDFSGAFELVAASTPLDGSLYYTRLGPPHRRQCYSRDGGVQKVFSVLKEPVEGEGSPGDYFYGGDFRIGFASYFSDPSMPTDFRYGPIIRNTDDDTFTVLLDINIYARAWHNSGPGFGWELVGDINAISDPAGTDYDFQTTLNLLGHEIELWFFGGGGGVGGALGTLDETTETTFFTPP